MSKNRKELLLEKKTIRRFAQLANVSLNENYLSEQDDEELLDDAADDLEKADELEMDAEADLADAADDMEAAEELEMDAAADELKAAEPVEVDPVELATAIMDAVEEVVPGVVVDVAPEAEEAPEEELEMDMEMEEELPAEEAEMEMAAEEPLEMEEEELEAEEELGRRGMYESKRKMNDKMLNEITDRVYKRLQEMARKQKQAATARKTRRTKK